MKKHLLVLLVLCFLWLTACGAPDEAETTSAGVTQETKADINTQADQALRFELESLPQIGDSAARAEQKRWYDTFQSTLQPREDYGQLIPFIGDVYRFAETSQVYDPYHLEVLNYRYGLMTEGGKIVVDAVFPYLEYYDVGTCGVYIVTAFASDDIPHGDNQQQWNTGGYVIAGNGAWSIRVPDGKEAFVRDSVIVIGASPEDGYKWTDDSEIYNMQGKYLFTVQNDDVDWENNLVFVDEYKGVIVRIIEKYSYGTSDGFAFSFYDRTGKHIVPDWAEHITVEELYENDYPQTWEPDNAPPESGETVYLETTANPYAVYERYDADSKTHYICSLWDTQTQTYRFKDYDYIRAMTIGGNAWILTVKNGICRVLDADLHPLYHSVAGL